MRRITFAAIISLVFLATISQTGTRAVNNTLSERFAFSTPSGETGSYSFDKNHSFIGFKVRHMGLIEVPGFFRDFTGTVNYNADDISRSTVEFTAKVTSVDTGVNGRDNHLRSQDFFEVEKYPDLSFKSTKVEKKGKIWMLTGDLTMKAVTKSITFPFEIVGFIPGDERSGGRMGLTAETTINRKDYGVDYDRKLPNGTASVSDEIKVVLQIEASAPRPAPAAKTE